MTTPITKVLLVMMENQNQDSIVGTKSTAPYMNSLAQKYGYCTNFKGLTGKSLPNYFALTAGQLLVSTDVEPPSQYQQTARSIFDNLNSKGLTWNTFAELLPSTCYQGSSKLPFSVHHVPALYFKSITSNAAQCAKIEDSTKLNAVSLPNYTMLVPDNDHNCHNGPFTIPAADTWLKSFLAPILASSDFGSGRLAIFIVFDNSWTGNGVVGGSGLVPSPCIVVWNNMTTPVVSNNAYNHYNVLATIGSLLGLPTLKIASVMNEFFQQHTTKLLVVISSSPNPGIVNESLTLTADVSNGTGSYNYSWTGLPTGMSASNSNKITGTPDATGTYDVTLSVIDSNGDTGSGSQNINVVNQSQAISVNISTDVIPIVNQPLIVSAKVSGGVPPYNYIWSNLPTGLTPSDSATITGTPITSGTYDTSVDVTDSASHSGSGSLTIDVTTTLIVGVVVSIVGAIVLIITLLVLRGRKK